MDDYKRLADNLKGMMPRKVYMMQGIVESVDGLTCTVKMGNEVVNGVKLTSSMQSQDLQYCIVPAVGSAVVFASLTGDMGNLVIVQYSHVESITVNGGKLGGMVNIYALTDKINELVEAFNAHTHTVSTTGTSSKQEGTAAPVISKASAFVADDYEDKLFKH